MSFAPGSWPTGLDASLTEFGNCPLSKWGRDVDRALGKGLYIRVQIDGKRKWVRIGTIRLDHEYSRKILVCIDDKMNASWLQADAWRKKDAHLL